MSSLVQTLVLLFINSYNGKGRLVCVGYGGVSSWSLFSSGVGG